jgi:phosphatidate cytidylyltransferase
MTWMRIATAAVMIPAVVAVVWWGSTGLVTALAGLVTLLALLEFFALGERIGLHGYRIWTSVCALAVLFQQWAATEAQSWTLGRNFRLTRSPVAAELPLELVLFVFVLGAAAIVFLSSRPLADALGDIGISAAGLLFVVLPFSALVRLDGVSVIGRRLVLFTLTLVWAGDTLAYFIGRWFGHMRMAPELSPKKTWEGAAANLLGSLLVGVSFARWLHIDAWQMVVMAGLANVGGQAGDLIESAYKRSAGAKDSGTLLPGHGGMLDRIDAMILVAPVVWYYFELVLAAKG